MRSGWGQGRVAVSGSISVLGEQAAEQLGLRFSFLSCVYQEVQGAQTLLELWKGRHPEEETEEGTAFQT